MCTVSWLPEPHGYTVCFNRDERRSRAPADAPARREAAGVRFLAPLDTEAGGTWLVANEFGLTLTLLNRYRVAGYQPPPAPRSRGLVVLGLAEHGTARDALAALEGADLVAVQPFSLVAIEPGQPARIAAWDGRTLAVVTHHPPGLILTSSAVTEPEVAVARRAAFETLGTFTAGGLRALHRSHLPERGRCSICMHREDAETRSYSEVAVTPDRVELVHVPGAPCREPPLAPEQLSRRLPTSLSNR